MPRGIAVGAAMSIRICAVNNCVTVDVVNNSNSGIATLSFKPSTQLTAGV